MNASIIYSETLNEFRMGTRRIVSQGGQWSGKTVNILMALATLCSEETSGVTTVTSQSFPHLKGGALRDFEMYVYPEFKKSIKQYHRTDHIFTFHSGSILEFKVFENEMAARGQKRKRLFVNEANSFPYMIFWQLDSRSEQTVIDYNPSIRFWAHTELIGMDGTKLFISDHRHNPFLTEARHREIEGIRDTELWKVYARGLTGNIVGVIFPDWQMIDTEDYPEDEQQVFSVDFGYTNDPTAIIKQCKVGDTLFVKELAYETGMPPKQIRMILNANGYDADKTPFFAEHDPDAIRGLRNLGVTVFPARKGQGSVNAGIELLKRFDVKYTASSRNLHKELGLYIWLPDEAKPGKLTNIPVDSNNHCFVGDTLIGNKRLIDIAVGDSVLTSEGYKKVLMKWNNGKKLVYDYCLDGITLTCTPDHLIKTDDGWKNIASLRSLDKIFLSDTGSPHVVQRIDTELGRYEDVYDLTVEDAHEYFANGVLVHNCIDAIRYGSYSRYLRNVA